MELNVGMGEVAVDVDVELLVNIDELPLVVVGPSSAMELTSVVGEKEAQSAEEVLEVCGSEEVLPVDEVLLVDEVLSEDEVLPLVLEVLLDRVEVLLVDEVLSEDEVLTLVLEVLLDRVEVLGREVLVCEPAVELPSDEVEVADKVPFVVPDEPVVEDPRLLEVD